jgi:hypothetical protein
MGQKQSREEMQGRCQQSKFKLMGFCRNSGKRKVVHSSEQKPRGDKCSMCVLAQVPGTEEMDEKMGRARPSGGA